MCVELCACDILIKIYISPNNFLLIKAFRPSLPIDKPDPIVLQKAREERVKELTTQRLLRHICAYLLFLSFTIFLAHQNIDKRSYQIREDMLGTYYDTTPSFETVSANTPRKNEQIAPTWNYTRILWISSEQRFRSKNKLCIKWDWVYGKSVTHSTMATQQIYEPKVDDSPHR